MIEAVFRPVFRSSLFRGIFEAIAPPAFSPSTLFALAEAGVWLDPSDLSTLFQDTAGSTPVTAPGQTTARINDKSVNATQATQAIAAARPTYSIEPVGGRRNLLTQTEAFNESVWVKTGTTITENASTAPNGTVTADKLVMTSATGLKRVSVSVAVTVGQSYTDSVYAKAAEISTLVFRFAGGENVSFDLAANSATITGTFYTAAYIEDVGDGWKRCSAAFTPTVTPYAVFYGPSAANTTGNNVDGLLIWGAQLELGSTATAYQKVTNRHDVTESGVASVSYLYDDLAGDALNWTAPIGTYSIAFVDNLGNVTIQTLQSLSGATDVLAVQKLAGYLAINRALTAAETASLTKWFEAKAGM